MAELLSPLALVERAIADAVNNVDEIGKIGKRVLQPLVGAALADVGFDVDLEDRGELLPARIPVWRSMETGLVEETKARRLVDVVVYGADGRLVALVETESDLNDLRSHGVSRRSGHYDVHSIARNAAGAHFHSYKSLERMAVAAYVHAGRLDGRQDRDALVMALERISSDLPADHNPARIGLFLIAGQYRRLDRAILGPRIQSLKASLIGRQSD